MGAKKRSKQSRATDTITANQANRGTGGPGVRPPATLTARAAPNGSPGPSPFPGQAGVTGTSGFGTGSGVVGIPGSQATITNTKIAGNNAADSGNDVSDH